MQGIPGMSETQWVLLTQHIGTLLAGSETKDWKPLLKQCFDDMAIQDRVKWIFHNNPSAEIWSSATHQPAKCGPCSSIRSQAAATGNFPSDRTCIPAVSPQAGRSSTDATLGLGALRWIRRSLRSRRS